MTMSAPDPEELSPAASDLPPPSESPLLTALPLATPELVGPLIAQAAETIVSSQPEIAPVRDEWALIALVPFDGREPPAETSDDLASAVWCAVSALWHPSLLARAATLPRIEPVNAPSAPGPREIRVIASGTWDQLPSGYRTQAEDSSAALVESGTDRALLIRQLQTRLGVGGDAELLESEGMSTSALDFLALGTLRWMLRDLTIAMGHAESLDHESLARELLAGAHSWRIGDWASAINRLRAGFEVLTQARERFYPVDAYLLDLCLIDPAMTGSVLADPLERPLAISFIAPGQAIENQHLLDAQRVAALRQAVADGWADVAGGTYSEAEDPLLPLESLLWQFRRGCEVYRLHLDDRNVETFARRRFGLHPQLPQIAKRFGFQYALHVGFDAGRFPIRSETKRLWESPDGSSLESLLRPPLAADRPSQGWILPWRIAATMKNDHVAAVPLVHWPRPVAPWYLDLRRVGAYSPVLGRWATLNDFFHLTDRPYETFRPEPDLYQTPYLAQAVAKNEREPISRLARHHRLRARLDAAHATGALRALSPARPPPPLLNPKCRTGCRRSRKLKTWLRRIATTRPRPPWRASSPPGRRRSGGAFSAIRPAPQMPRRGRAAAASWSLTRRASPAEPRSSCRTRPWICDRRAPSAPHSSPTRASTPSSISPHSGSRGFPKTPTRVVLRHRPPVVAPAAGSSETSRWKSRSTPPPEASVAWRPWVNRWPGSGSRSS